MKKYMILLVLIIALLFAWCEKSTSTDEQEEQVESWTDLSTLIDISDTWVDPDDVRELDRPIVPETEEWTWVYEELFADTMVNTWEESLNLENQLVESTPQGVWFADSVCNQIYNFDLCIISKAPLENQEVMKEHLERAVESWKILGASDLHKVCYDIIQRDSFRDIVAHYQSIEDWCHF